ncbi:unnamed protein product [Pylaiella littoralis]
MDKLLENLRRARDWARRTGKESDSSGDEYEDAVEDFCPKAGVGGVGPGKTSTILGNNGGGDASSRGFSHGEVGGVGGTQQGALSSGGRRRAKHAEWRPVQHQQQLLDEAAQVEREEDAAAVQDAVSALGTPATVVSAAADAGSGWAALGLGLGALKLSAFGEATEDEMRRLFQDRKALFESMTSGPGIAATKFSRRGRPRGVVITLVPPPRGRSEEGGGGGGGALAGLTPTSAAGGGGGGGSVDSDRRSPSTPSRPGSWLGMATLARATSQFLDAVGGNGRKEHSARSPSFKFAHFHQPSPPPPPQPQQQQQHDGETSSLNALLGLELVWNRHRGGKGSLRVGQITDVLAGMDSQVLKPVCEELRKQAASRGGGGVYLGEEEHTFASLRTGQRNLDLKFPTVSIRNRFVLAFKSLVWETAQAAGRTPTSTRF